MADRHLVTDPGLDQRHGAGERRGQGRLSIFIASSTASGGPWPTRSPGATRSLVTFPGNGRVHRPASAPPRRRGEAAVLQHQGASAAVEREGQRMADDHGREAAAHPFASTQTRPPATPQRACSSSVPRRAVKRSAVPSTADDVQLLAVQQPDQATRCAEVEPARCRAGARARPSRPGAEPGRAGRARLERHGPPRAARSNVAGSSARLGRPPRAGCPRGRASPWSSRIALNSGLRSRRAQEGDGWS